MGRRRFSVADHPGVEELAARYRAARDPVERGRWRMIRLLVPGRPLAEVADVTGYGTYVWHVWQDGEFAPLDAGGAVSAVAPDDR